MYKRPSLSMKVQDPFLPIRKGKQKTTQQIWPRIANNPAITQCIVLHPKPFSLFLWASNDLLHQIHEKTLKLQTEISVASFHLRPETALITRRKTWNENMLIFLGWFRLQVLPFRFLVLTRKWLGVIHWRNWRIPGHCSWRSTPLWLSES